MEEIQVRITIACAASLAAEFQEMNDKEKIEIQAVLTKVTFLRERNSASMYGPVQPIFCGTKVM
jgi:hypothetical protein